MGRAERRRAERMARIEDRKGKILMSRDELSQYKNDAQDSVARSSAEYLMTSFALVLYEHFDFDIDQITECLSAVDDYMGMINSNEITMQDIIKRLEDIGFRVEVD